MGVGLLLPGVFRVEYWGLDSWNTAVGYVVV